LEAAAELLRGEVVTAGTVVEWPLATGDVAYRLRRLDRLVSPPMIKSDISLIASM
jgi:hypothetical protein